MEIAAQIFHPPRVFIALGLGMGGTEGRPGRGPGMLWISTAPLYPLL